MPDISFLGASLASLCMESLFYGIFLVLSIATLYILASRRAALARLPWNGGTRRRFAYITPMSAAAVCLFLTNTAHWIIDVYRTFQAFVIIEGGSQPSEFLSDVPQPSDVCKLSVLMASLIIGDMMLVYRLWIVWAYTKLVVILPLGTLVGLIVCAIGALYEISMAQKGIMLFQSSAGYWITANCVFTLCTNVYSSAFIAWRIWRANKDTQRFGGSNLLTILGIVIESAALYTTWTILFFVTYLLQCNLAFTFSDTYSSIAGIAFMLITVRVGMGWAQRTIYLSDVSSRGIGVSSQGQGGPFAMGHLAINVTRVVDRDDGLEAHAKFASCSHLQLPRPVHTRT